ncbi:MAG TPA: FtsQ-type POTRA domain-containing protein [Terriglobales bacterium]|nr:FtsQ-type POTRA domain-containing protein [Terriglobales bacterium]
MAQKASSTISEEELYPHSGDAAHSELRDPRLLDLEVEQESPFLRAQKRVPVRRAAIPAKTIAYLAWAALTFGFVFVVGVAGLAAYRYGQHSWRFRVESSDEIEITGLANVTRSQVMEVMGEDIGRNIFFVPLGQRKKQLEQIPWVESASLMRFVPNRLKIEIQERRPAAFARVGSKILLIDTSGVLMDLPVSNRRRFSFPVVLGMNLAEPQSTRAERMKTYSRLVAELDSGGAHYSQDVSEVDLSDPEDVKVLASDAGGEVLVHLGSSDFLERFKIYMSHVQQWRQQFARLDSVDLRYQHQIIVNPDFEVTAKQPPLSASQVRAALAAGVRPATLVNRDFGKATRPSATLSVSQVPAKSGAGKKGRGLRRSGARARGNARRSVLPGPVTETTAPWGDGSRIEKTAPSIPAAGEPTKPAKPSPAIPKEQAQE